MYGAQWYVREPIDVIDEIKEYTARYNVFHFEMYDLTTIVQRKWILAFARALQQENLGITWTMPVGTRSEALDHEVLEAIFASGCTSMVYAPESGDAATLKRIKKKVNLDNLVDSVRAAIRIGFKVRIHIIQGFPEQSVREMWNSYRFVMKMAFVGIHDVNIFVFAPYPGSELFFQLVEQGVIRPDAVDYDLFLARIIFTGLSGSTPWNKHLNPFFIALLVRGGMFSFYLLQFVLRPRRIVSTLRNVLARTPQTSFERILIAVGLRWYRGRYVHPASSVQVGRRG